MRPHASLPTTCHGLAFNKDDQLFAGSVLGQAIYKVQVDSGEVDRFVDPPVGMTLDGGQAARH